MSEFSIIEHCFKRRFAALGPQNDVCLGIGDDAAVIDRHAFLSAAGAHLVTCVDTLVAGVHFPLPTSPYDIAYKALAVNLSDMAAMGALPRWMTLALTVPEACEIWLNSFSEGLAQIAKRFGVQLVGGDTTQGPLTVTIQLMGTVEADAPYLVRSGACPGQLLCVSGDLGGAALGLQGVVSGDKGEQDDGALSRLNRPEPRVQLGRLLKQYATSCIDLSDGLLGDLKHLCEASNCAADIELDRVPVYPGLLTRCSEEEAITTAMTFGDDYELLFTLDACCWSELQAKVAHRDDVPAITSIGRIKSLSCAETVHPISLYHKGAKAHQLQAALFGDNDHHEAGVGYEHFTKNSVVNDEA